jgi:hypothetical protein
VCHTDCKFFCAENSAPICFSSNWIALLLAFLGRIVWGKGSYPIGTWGCVACALRTLADGRTTSRILAVRDKLFHCRELAGALQIPLLQNFHVTMSRRSDSQPIYLDKLLLGVVGAFVAGTAQSEFSGQLWYTLTGGNFPPFLRVLRDVRNPWRFKKSA